MPHANGAFYFTKSSAIKQFSFNKAEKLKSRKLIEHLFSNGKSINLFPVKLLYDFVDESDKGVKAGVTTSSRNFRKAVERNRIKRVVREAYRLQKLPLHQAVANKGRKLVLFFIYTGKQLPDFEEVYKTIGVILQRLVNKIEEQSGVS